MVATKIWRFLSVSACCDCALMAGQFTGITVELFVSNEQIGHPFQYQIGDRPLAPMGFSTTQGENACMQKR